jgi:hypothetical protein
MYLNSKAHPSILELGRKTSPSPTKYQLRSSPLCRLKLGDDQHEHYKLLHSSSTSR